MLPLYRYCPDLKIRNVQKVTNKKYGKIETLVQVNLYVKTKNNVLMLLL